MGRKDKKDKRNDGGEDEADALLLGPGTSNGEEGVADNGVGGDTGVVPLLPPPGAVATMPKGDGGGEGSKKKKDKEGKKEKKDKKDGGGGTGSSINDIDGAGGGADEDDDEDDDDDDKKDGKGGKKKKIKTLEARVEFLEKKENDLLLLLAEVDVKASMGSDLAGRVKAALSAAAGPGGKEKNFEDEEEAKLIAKMKEPKTMFSLERTLLSWINATLKLGAIGTGLLTFFAHEKAVLFLGVVLWAIALIFMFYAVMRFRQRGTAIENSQLDGPFYDRNGPVALMLSVAAAAIAYVLIIIINAPKARIDVGGA